MAGPKTGAGWTQGKVLVRGDLALMPGIYTAARANEHGLTYVRESEFPGEARQS
jgi:hypothetical protein